LRATGALFATIFVDYATTAGGLAGSIAVMGFVFQAFPVFKGPDSNRVRRFTAAGGLLGSSSE
jgi:hypothetical protein